MIVYRVAVRKRITDLSGTGSFLVGGRWTSEGTYAVYTGQSPSLCYLEYMAHQFGKSKETWPRNLALAELEVRDNSLIKALRLPPGWNKLPYHPAVQKFGDTLLADRSKSGFIVPSALMEKEFNYVLNPLAENFKKNVKLKSVFDFEIDSRFYR
jgi:RES domain-containing protein